MLGRERGLRQTPVGLQNLIKSAAISFLTWWLVVLVATILPVVEEAVTPHPVRNPFQLHTSVIASVVRG